MQCCNGNEPEITVGSFNSPAGVDNTTFTLDIQVNHPGACVTSVGGAVEPGGFSLTVSPNPAVVHSVVSIDVPIEQPIVIGVYDVSGRLLKRILDCPLPVGLHHVEWDLRDAAGSRVRPGLYFVRLTSTFGGKASRVAVVQ
jgi:hypothetical protein